MKRFVLFVLLAITIWTYGQNFRLGFTVSPQMSWMSSTSVAINNNQSKVGLDFGLMADFYLTPNQKYILNTGLTVTTHSARVKYNMSDPFEFSGKTLPAQSEITYALKYLELPLTLKLRTKPVRRFTYYGQFGVAGYFNLSASAISNDGVLDGSIVSEEISLFNAGMHLGGGAEYDVGGNTSLLIGVQYTNGFLDITTISGMEEKTTMDNVRLVFGVMF